MNVKVVFFIVASCFIGQVKTHSYCIAVQDFIDLYKDRTTGTFESGRIVCNVDASKKEVACKLFNREKHGVIKKIVAPQKAIAHFDMERALFNGSEQICFNFHRVLKFAKYNYYFRSIEIKTKDGQVIPGKKIQEAGKEDGVQQLVYTVEPQLLLLQAVQQGNLKSIEHALEQQASLIYKNDNDKTALMLATNNEIITYLFARALQAGDIEGVKQQLTTIEDKVFLQDLVNGVIDKHSLIEWAVDNKEKDLIQLLFDNGAKVSPELLQQISKYEDLHTHILQALNKKLIDAVQNNNKQATQDLLKQGADAATYADGGLLISKASPPLQKILFEGMVAQKQTKIIEQFLHSITIEQRVSFVNLKSNKGSLLEIAYTNKDQEMLRLLIEMGAHLSVSFVEDTKKMHDLYLFIIDYIKEGGKKVYAAITKKEYARAVMLINQLSAVSKYEGVDIANYSYEEQANGNVKNSILTYAVQNNAHEVITALVQEGADTQRIIQGREYSGHIPLTPLYIALLVGNKQTIALLLNAVVQKKVLTQQMRNAFLQHITLLETATQSSFQQTCKQFFINIDRVELSIDYAGIKQLFLTE